MTKVRYRLLVSPTASITGSFISVHKWRVLKTVLFASAVLGSYVIFLLLSAVNVHYKLNDGSNRTWMDLQLPFSLARQKQKSHIAVQDENQLNDSDTIFYSAETWQIVDELVAKRNFSSLRAHSYDAHAGDAEPGRSVGKFSFAAYRLFSGGASDKQENALSFSGKRESKTEIPPLILALPAPTFVADIRSVRTHLSGNNLSSLSMETLRHRALSLHSSFSANSTDEQIADTYNDTTGFCMPHRNIMFLKTHKCASSTVQNIIMRYGLENHLNFVLPPVSNYLGHPAKFRSSYAVPLLGSKAHAPVAANGAVYNIFTHHTRFDCAAIASLMPSNTTFITILREPAAHFESLYKYVDLEQRYGVPLHNFLRYPAKFYRSSRERLFAWNPMMFDLGLDVRAMRDEAQIDAKIAEIDQKFSVVLISEFFKEGLVILSSVLCWPLESVVALRRNARPESKKTALIAADAGRIYNWNAADKKLYDFFYAKFQLQMDLYGRQRLASDVALLDDITERTEAECGFLELEPGKIANAQYKPWKPYVRGYVPSGGGAHNETCQALARAENPFTDLLRARQWPARFGAAAMARAAAVAASRRAAAARKAGNVTSSGEAVIVVVKSAKSS